MASGPDGVAQSPWASATLDLQRGSRKNVNVRVFGPVLLLVWCNAAICQTPEQPIVQYFRSGQQALQQREFARAAEDFKKVLALDPTIVEAEVNLGLAYQGLLQYDLAVRYLAKALKERPNLPGPTSLLDWTTSSWVRRKKPSRSWSSRSSSIRRIASLVKPWPRVT